jgi:hypothetical protein
MSNLFIHIRNFKQVPKYLATGLQRPSGTYSPPAEASIQGLYDTNFDDNLFLYGIPLAENTTSCIKQQAMFTSRSGE